MCGNTSAVGNFLFICYVYRSSVILIEVKICFSVRPEFNNAFCLIETFFICFRDFSRVIILLIHRNNRARFHKQRHFPYRRVIVVQDLSAPVLLSAPVINPDLLLIRQINAVAHIISFRVCLHILVDRRYQQIFAPHILILGSLCICRGRIVREFQEHGTDHRFAFRSFLCNCINIRHHLRF